MRHHGPPDVVVLYLRLGAHTVVVVVMGVVAATLCHQDSQHAASQAQGLQEEQCYGHEKHS